MPATSKNAPPNGLNSPEEIWSITMVTIAHPLAISIYFSLIIIRLSVFYKRPYQNDQSL